MKTPVVKVSDLAEQIRGVSYGKGDASDAQTPGCLPVLRAGNITDNGLVFDDLVFVPADCISEKQKVRRHDVVIAASSGSLDVVGKAASALTDFDGGFGAFCKVLRPNSKVHPRYFAHFFKTRAYRRRVSDLAAGANINNLKNEHLDDLDIPLPPLAEQERIAAVLDAADALRAKRRHALTRLDALARSLFLHHFGDPVSNPKGWPVVPLGDVIIDGPQSGAYFPKEAYSDDGIEMAHMGDIFNEYIEPGSLRRVNCTSADISKYGLSADDLIIARRSINYEGAAKPCKVSANATPILFESSLIRIRPRSELTTASYLYQYLSNPSARQQFVVPYVTKATISGINQANLVRIKVMLPPLALQRRFADELAVVERMKATQRAHLAKLDTLFAALQDRAFSGKL